VKVTGSQVLFIAAQTAARGDVFMTSKRMFWTSAFGLFAAAGLACGQVTPGSFTPTAFDDYESYGGGRSIISSVFGGAVPVIPGTVTHNSVNGGDWIDFRTGGPVQAQSGGLFGVQFGFGSFTLDFTGGGGTLGFSGWACAAGVGNDVIEFFDMSGAPMTGTFTKIGGFGAGGVMEQFSFVSSVPIGSIRLTGVETCFDDIASTVEAPTVCPTCLADCDGSGSLDFFDFLCFQNLFGAGHLCADCDGSGGLDFFDFLCFQDAFAERCPPLQIVQHGAAAPPSLECGRLLTVFPRDPRLIFEDVTAVPSPLGGEVTFDIPCNHRVIGTWIRGWHGYADSVYYTNGAARLAMEIPPNGTFRFYLGPNPFMEIEFEITAAGAGGEASVVAAITGAVGAAGFAICGGVETITIGATDGVSDFAVGWFAIDD
jgi:hypothetical protein